MNVEKMFESRFIKSADFNGKDWTFTISGVSIEKLDGKKGLQKKGIVSFEAAEKPWVINRTNALCCVAMWGKETDNWIGKRITLHPVVWQGEELAIRVKGSPDLEKSIPVEISLPKKSPFTMTMQKTNPGDRITPRGSMGRAATMRPASAGSAGSSGSGRAPASSPPDADGPEPSDEEIAASAARAQEQDVNF
jgi:hypothetical protein